MLVRFETPEALRDPARVAASQLAKTRLAQIPLYQNLCYWSHLFLKPFPHAAAAAALDAAAAPPAAAALDELASAPPPII